MVSNVLGMSPQELNERLQAIRAQHADDPDYQRLRAALPDDWPV